MDIKVGVNATSLVGQQLLNLNLDKNITRYQSMNIGTYTMPELYISSRNKTIDAYNEDITR
jgi:hypothetical protein